MPASEADSITGSISVLEEDNRKSSVRCLWREVEMPLTVRSETERADHPESKSRILLLRHKDVDRIDHARKKIPLTEGKEEYGNHTDQFH